MRNLDIKTKYGIDRYMMIDSGELKTVAADNAAVVQKGINSFGSDWSGASYQEFERKIVVGDNDLVRESDDFLRQIEDQVPMSRGWRNVDDVVGAVPNIPAFLAGHPQCMRRRERTMRDNAPLAIYMDLTSSAMISARDVQRRGVTLLALVRQLVEHRPVELWVGISLGKGWSRSYGSGNSPASGTVAWKIDTAPLDLARAAFYISATVMARGFGYNISNHRQNTGGGWPLDSHDLHCRTAKERLGAVFTGQEMLYIPPIIGYDELVSKPVEWIKRTMASYVQQPNAA
jgi:hypothetical protein